MVESCEDQDLIRFFHENTKRNLHGTISDPDISSKPSVFKEYASAPRIRLPNNARMKQISLEEAILQRRSCRNFARRNMSLPKLSRLLRFAYGITESIEYQNFEIPLRPAPSAGALYPCEIYPVVLNVSRVEKGVYHYCPIDHSLELLKSGNFANRLAQLFMGQSYIAKSSVCFIISGVFERIAWKYGARGYRYMLLEAGQIAQNVCLAAVAEELASLPLGGFYDNPLSRFLEINPEDELILYGLAVGYARGGKMEEPIGGL